MLTIILLVCAFVFILISKLISYNVKEIKSKHQIQSGEITYSDLNSPAKPLFSKRYRIAGKPDYIVRKNKYYIPVEVKTGNHFNLQKNHVFQLAAYCQILEENYGGFVPCGVVVYTDTSKQFEIPFNPQLRFELESTISDMRNILKTKNISRNHNDHHKCRNCSMKKYCNEKLI